MNRQDLAIKSLRSDFRTLYGHPHPPPQPRASMRDWGAERALQSSTWDCTQNCTQTKKTKQKTPVNTGLTAYTKNQVPFPLLGTIYSSNPLIFMYIITIKQLGQTVRHTQKHHQHSYVNRYLYYFSRLIPSDLKHHYSKPHIIQSLKTKCSHRATTAPKILPAKLGDYWSIWMAIFAARWRSANFCTLPVQVLGMDSNM